MKVIVSYACDLEEIPANTSDLLKNLSSKLNKASKLLDDAVSESFENRVADTILSIDTLRQLLGQIDMRLVDCTNILAGYSKANADIHLGIESNSPQEQTSNDDEIKEPKTND